MFTTDYFKVQYRYTCIYHLLTFINLRDILFSTSEVVTNECQNFSYNLLKSTAMCYLQNVDIYLQLLIYTKFMVGFFFVNFCINKKSIQWIDISFVIESWIFFSFCYISQSLHFLYFVDLYFNLLVLLLFIFTSIDIYNIICFVDMFKNLYFLSLAISKNEELCYMYLPISTCRFKCQNFFFSIFTKR